SVTEIRTSSIEAHIVCLYTSMTSPKLPARKAGGKRVAPTNGGSLPILSAQELELDDGTRIPVKIPEGDGTPALGRCTAQPSTAQEVCPCARMFQDSMPPQQAQALLEYLKANPEAAKEVFSQAQQVLKNPGMAQAFMNMQGAAQQPGMADKYQALKDDPDLKSIYYQMSQEITKVAAKGSCERVMTDAGIPTEAQRTALLYRTGGLYNQKLAMRWGKAADDRCPLCGEADSATHLLSGCSRTAGLVQERHNGAGRLIMKAISKGAQGGCIKFADIGSHERGETEGIDLPSATLRKALEDLSLSARDTNMTTRPDIIMINNTKKRKQGSNELTKHHVFDDVVKNGPSAFQKYWDDVDLMAKISAKMRALQVEPSSAPSGLNSGRAPGSAAPLTSLHDAAKAGDEAAVIRLLDAGEKVDGKNERGITALGTAVGFNRVAVVSLLLSRGAEVDARDNQGNTALHYAAGYGRKEVAQLLLQAGADLAAVNKSGLTPCGAAAMNKETGMVSFLVAAAAEGRQGGPTQPAATQPAPPQPVCQAAAAPLTPSASPEPDAPPQ
ncbi:hypothetical protein QJQ45_021090, partial [Haematococcus lacustris]